MELGIYTFGDMHTDPVSGRPMTAPERMRQMMELARLADDAGLDVMGVGEHHALDYVNSATATMIAAMAAVTKRLRFTSACTVISTADPVRTFQEFATADLVSEGRVEVVFGRGAFTESFPLFGFSLDDYDELFAEKVELFGRINEAPRVTWSGKFRPALDNLEVAPRPTHGRLPVWIGAGSPRSAWRAASLGYPLALPVLGGSLQNYAHVAGLYRKGWAQYGHAEADVQLATFAHMHVAETSQQALDGFFPYYSTYLTPLFKGPMPRQIYSQMAAPQGSLMIGSPQQVIDKILLQQEALGSTRFVGQIDVGGQPFSMVAKAIELFADKIAPVVRAATAKPSVEA